MAEERESEVQKPSIIKNSVEINQITRQVSSLEMLHLGEIVDKSRPGWSWEQELLYYRFVKANRQRLVKQNFTKKYCKFIKMSQFISTKSVSQCRSHFQKTVVKYQSIDKFIGWFQQQLGEKKGREKIELREMGVQTESIVQQQQIYRHSKDSSEKLKQNKVEEFAHKMSIKRSNSKEKGQVES